MIKVQSLHYSYSGKKILEDISFTIEEGQFFTIIGPNGCGKTTLLRLITGYLRPEKGKVLLRGKKTSSLSIKERARNIAVVSQIYLTNPYFTVRKILEMGREPYLSFWRRIGPLDQELIQKYAKELALSDMLERKAGTLSGGELQRVMIAKALVQQTPIIIMDEPVNHLDIHHQVQVLDMLKKLSRNGKTIITVLHDLSFAAKYSDELLVLNNKKIAALGKPAKVFNSRLLAEVFQTDAYTISHQRLVLK